MNKELSLHLKWNKHFVMDNVPRLSKMIHMDLRPLYSIIKTGKYKGRLKFIPSKLAEKKRRKYIKTDKQKNELIKLMNLSFVSQIYNCGIFFPNKPKDMPKETSVTVYDYKGVHSLPYDQYVKYCTRLENHYNKVHHTNI